MNFKNNNSIIVVGSIAIDSLETPQSRRDYVLGGSASHFSVAASLFAPVIMVGVVGQDYPIKQLKLFNSRGINTDNVQKINGKTFRWGGKYNHDYSMRETLFTELGVFENFDPIIDSQSLFSPFVFLGNIQPDLQLSVANMMQKTKYIVSDTMNLWIDLFPNKVNEVISQSNILLINHEEAEQITGKDDPVFASRDFHNMGPECVVIKLGAGGSFLSHNKNTVHIPAYRVSTLVDPTGAGDSFAGGFLGQLASSGSSNFIAAAIAGTAAASFCVEGFGSERLLDITVNDLNLRMDLIVDKMRGG